MARTKGAVDKKPRKPRGGDKPRVLPGDGGPPPPGHNSGDLTEEQKQALFLQNLGKIGTLKAEMESINSKLRNAYKAAKADGFSKKDIDYAFELRKNEDKDMIERRRREQQIAKWLSHPIGTQPDMFDEPDRTPIKEQAYELGKVAGMEGQPCSPPEKYAVASEAGQAWIAGWHDGTVTTRSLFKEVPKSGAAPAEDDKEEPFDGLPEEGSQEGDEAAGATTH